MERYGSKPPLIVGPLVAAVGFALFALPGAEARSYWTSFFPAVMVMSIGMLISVAPLTTTVMGAVSERHAGVASGINNAVSRAASLVAVAVFGVIVLKVFNLKLAAVFQAMPLAPEVREQLLAESNNLANLKVPQNLSGETGESIRQAIRESFVAGFRVVAYVAASLAALSSLTSWILIEGKSQGKTKKTSSS